MNPEKTGNEHILFYDTYALYAIVKGEKNYEDFAKGYSVITTLMNLYELYYNLIKEDQIGLAEEFFNRLLSFCVDIKPEVIKKAAYFRIKSKKGLSYIDSLGYITAKEHNVKFLTGDNAFKDMINVKFVK